MTNPNNGFSSDNPFANGGGFNPSQAPSNGNANSSQTAPWSSSYDDNSGQQDVNNQSSGGQEQNGFGNAQGQSGFGNNQNQGGFNGGQNQGGFNGGQNQGGFDNTQGQNQNGFNANQNQGGGFNDGAQSGFGGNQGGFNGGNQNGFGGNQGGFNGGNQNGFGGNQGGFNGGNQDSFNGGNQNGFGGQPQQSDNTNQQNQSFSMNVDLNNVAGSMYQGGSNVDRGDIRKENGATLLIVPGKIEYDVKSTKYNNTYTRAVFDYLVLDGPNAGNVYYNSMNANAFIWRDIENAGKRGVPIVGQVVNRPTEKSAQGAWMIDTCLLYTSPSPRDS